MKDAWVSVSVFLAAAVLSLYFFLPLGAVFLFLALVLALYELGAPEWGKPPVERS